MEDKLSLDFISDNLCIFLIIPFPWYENLTNIVLLKWNGMCSDHQDLEYFILVFFKCCTILLSLLNELNVILPVFDII